MIKFLQCAYEAHCDYSEIKRKLEEEKLLTSKQFEVYENMIGNYERKYNSAVMSNSFLFLELNKMVYKKTDKLCKILSTIPVEEKKVAKKKTSKKKKEVKK